MTVIQTRYIYISSIFLFFHDSMTNTATLGYHKTWICTKVFLVIKKIRWIFPIKQKYFAPAAFWGSVIIGYSNPNLFGRKGCGAHALVRLDLVVVLALFKLLFYDIGKIFLSSLVRDHSFKTSTNFLNFLPLPPPIKKCRCLLDDPN